MSVYRNGEDMLKVELKYFYQEKIYNDTEFLEVLHCANKFLAFLNEDITINKITKANQPGSSSAKVQEILLEKAQKLGFLSEKTGLFSKYKTSGLRPDYFKKMNGTGILFEVERGKTIHNNMDLLDLEMPYM